MSKLIARIIAIRTSRGDWLISTSQCYEHGLKHFIKWYKENYESFDSTALLIKEWKKQAKFVLSNENSYKVVGNLALSVCDVMEAISHDG